jgi:hypothetical protein
MSRRPLRWATQLRFNRLNLNIIDSLLRCPRPGVRGVGHGKAASGVPDPYVEVIALSDCRIAIPAQEREDPRTSHLTWAEFR